MTKSPSPGTHSINSRYRYSSRFHIPSESNTLSVPIIPIDAITTNEFPDWLSSQPEITQKYISHTLKFVPNTKGISVLSILTPDSLELSRILVTLGTKDEEQMQETFGPGWISQESESWWMFGSLQSVLPNGYIYSINTKHASPYNIALSWALSVYDFKTQFNQFNSVNFPSQTTETPELSSSAVERPKLLIDSEILSKLDIEAAGIFCGRDLINYPAEYLTPFELESAVIALSQDPNLIPDDKSAQVHVHSFIGDDLIQPGQSYYPQVHAVGRAVDRSNSLPRVVWMEYNMDKTELPLVVLIGKGVCFDTGGLDLKPATGMRNMKKDMGGAACVISTAHMILLSRLGVRMKVGICCVENAVQGNAFRPGDVLISRNGISTEIENTDAEGRLILADALVAACENEDEMPDLVIDFATLTGAQRVALGSEIGGVFCTNLKLMQELEKASRISGDYLWPLPLYPGYESSLKSSIADTKNCAATGLGGAISAALYLRKFVPKNTQWIHLDINGFNNSSRPGRPEGGEPMGSRAIFHLLSSLYSN
eukprot:CAMPEP_0182445020 /NCGR_PEP_ID=MMETSP1172-20130603/3288_1 /TAXON_ID=708627 /ORGANISM="Timspurckia oligopyrenoides, Strain CCMP3278" /LENGTH=540 /DNA_ID=CAMNT_0024640715 /DNA_START=94 /DNA_END=1716 /DNA_ORIENTATION=+